MHNHIVILYERIIILQVQAFSDIHVTIINIDTNKIIHLKQCF